MSVIRCWKFYLVNLIITFFRVDNNETFHNLIVLNQIFNDFVSVSVTFSVNIIADECTVPLLFPCSQVPDQNPLIQCLQENSIILNSVLLVCSLLCIMWTPLRPHCINISNTDHGVFVTAVSMLMWNHLVPWRNGLVWSQCVHLLHCIPYSWVGHVSGAFHHM